MPLLVMKKMLYRYWKQSIKENLRKDNKNWSRWVSGCVFTKEKKDRSEWVSEWSELSKV